MKIIQISGKGRVGKTTLANEIQKLAFDLGYIPIIIPFANAIKTAASLNGLSKENNPEEYRKFCQQIGAEKRKEDPDYWVVRSFESIQNLMLKEVDNKKENKKHWEYVIIQDDVRYMNEIAFGRELAAIQIFIDSGMRKLLEHDAEWRSHESEEMANAVEESFFKPNSNYEEIFDVIIFNGGTLEEFIEEINESIEEWLDIASLDVEEENEQTN
jgi:guanylate kinase